MEQVRRSLRRLAAPLDRLILAARTIRGVTAPPPRDDATAPEDLRADGRMVHLLPREDRGWPEVRLPLPSDAVFQLYEEAFFRRIAMWLTAEPVEALMEQYRSALADAGTLRSEQIGEEVRRVSADLSGARLVISIAGPVTGIRTLGITQHSR